MNCLDFEIQRSKVKVTLRAHMNKWAPYFLPFPSRWTTSSAEAVHQLRPNVQPRHNQRLGKSISSSYELERMHDLHRIKS